MSPREPEPGVTPDRHPPAASHADPREDDLETAENIDPKSGRSDDPRVEPTPPESQ